MRADNFFKIGKYFDRPQYIQYSNQINNQIYFFFNRILFVMSCIDFLSCHVLISRHVMYLIDSSSLNKIDTFSKNMPLTSDVNGTQNR